ncbi:two-component response regulator-like APRR5 isoform X2 [Cicer arietinum]|uniref:Two-component response regulator-like APRR5 isoform X2 n=1 Tax=Cicer arietinum TaxID=3827 RepID=A0A1S2YCC7_CICAR|nr:two-component response regulator-like APRR5 isoform X2 [Cicer arietinum]
MGEVVRRREKEDEKLREEEESGAESRGGEMKGLMRWEKFLPRMVLRVLLVEADDSTRQIITALLRKCNYKVAAVADGLKAWEILKGRPGSIDLILTEVDLPSISGYALLTLIMEHDSCKSIPVIMMSSQDSVSTVYKCMLRGAADYLVKPIRINELRNLWQHVWRRQSSNTGVNGPQDESDAQQKVEATAENNAASNHSGGGAACIQRNKELIEKGSDAQSSCTKPNMEAESGSLVDIAQEFSPTKCAEAYPSGIQTHEVDIQLGQASTPQDNHDRGLSVANCKNGETNTNNDKDGDDPSISGEVHDNHYDQTDSSKEAIDLIGAFRSRPNCGLNNSSTDCTGKFEYSPQLDLSLRSSHHSNFEKELNEERHTLMHSNASAFKRYTNRQLQASPAVVLNFPDQQREQKINNENHIAAGCNSDSSIPSKQKCIVSPATAQSKESELATSHSQQGHSLPIPVKGVRFNDLCMAYGSALPPGFRTQSGPPSTPGSVTILEPNFQAEAFYQSNGKENNAEQPYEPRHSNGNNARNQIVYTQEHKSEHAEDQRLISPTTDQSVSSSFCNGNASHLNSIGYGSNCGSNSNVEQVATFRTATVSEGKNEELTNSGYSHRSILREAALNKFRLKRKERCYEKKVRYESRKKLAEQRPRVKGQFVRQVNPESIAAEKDGNEY